jgi:hypothetical protein
MIPRPRITARAQLTTETAVYVTYTITDTAVNSIYTTTLLLGNSPTPTPAPIASSNPTNGAVIGAVIGSIIGFFLLLALIVVCVRRSNSDWAPSLRSSSFSSIYVSNPNVLPTRTVVRERTTTSATRVIRDNETRTFFFIRPIIRRTRSPVRNPVDYYDTSESSLSSEP